MPESTSTSVAGRSPSSTRRLTLDDILDLRAYERARESIRAKVIALKRIRRVSVGPLVTLVFENAETVRFQVQEMARAERMLEDRLIQAELDVYNPLIPEPGELAATLMIELTTPEDLREWLPKLVGIERSVFIEMISPENESERERVAGQLDPAQEEVLTRQDTTAAVNYLHFSFSPDQVANFRDRTVYLLIDHPAYSYKTELSSETKASLLEDLLP